MQALWVSDARAMQRRGAQSFSIVGDYVCFDAICMFDSTRKARARARPMQRG